MSCGCYKNELTSARTRTHGLSNRPEYFAAWHAFERCHNPKSKWYRIYGARGIKCEFENAAEMTKWLVKHLPKPKGRFLLDRKNNNGNYQQGNLRWVDFKTSARNKRTNRMITIAGETRPIIEWSELSGVGAMTIHGRIKAGQSEDLWLFKGRITKQMLWEREYGQ